MRHLNSILSLTPYTDRETIFRSFDRCRSIGGDISSPIQATLPSSDDTSYKLLFEFDGQGHLAFAELTAAIKGEGKALDEFHRLAPRLLRNGDAYSPGGFLPPILRTGMPMYHLLACSTLLIDDMRRLQILVGAMYSAAARSERTHLAVGLHIGSHLPGYGPKKTDISTGEALGWQDYFRVARPDLSGRTIMIESSQVGTTGWVGATPPEAPTVFRIFPLEVSSSSPASSD